MFRFLTSGFFSKECTRQGLIFVFRNFFKDTSRTKFGLFYDRFFWRRAVFFQKANAFYFLEKTCRFFKKVQFPPGKSCEKLRLSEMAFLFLEKKRDFMFHEELFLILDKLAKFLPNKYFCGISWKKIKDDSIKGR